MAAERGQVAAAESGVEPVQLECGSADAVGATGAAVDADNDVDAVGSYRPGEWRGYPGALEGDGAEEGDDGDFDELDAL